VISSSRDPNLTKHNTHKRQKYMFLEEFEPAFTASNLPQTHALDHAGTGIVEFNIRPN
jgi:hypothetical protein